MKVAPDVPPPPPAAPPPLPTAPPRAIASAADSEAIEQTLGGRAVAYTGVAAVMLGIAFFVVYAIQRAWLGPEVRVAAGLLAGAALVVIGHRLSRQPTPPLGLARLLTGGGAGLFYFSLYAASAFYGLLTPGVTFFALAGISGVVLALATLYRSPTIAVLALLGAHGSPLVAGGDAPDAVFTLIVTLIVNLPVIALTARHGWTAPAVLAFALAWLQYAAAAFRVWTGLDAARWAIATAIAAGLWVEVGLVADRLWVRTPARPRASLVLHALNSLALLGALARWFDTDRLSEWFGAALLGGALAHVGWALPLRRHLGAAAGPVVVRLLAGLAFACFALPAQLDGAWVSAGWILGGLLIARLTDRLDLPLGREAALVMGLTGLVKSLLYDAVLYESSPRLFFNARFAVSLLGAVGLAGQSRAWAVRRPATAPEQTPPTAGVAGSAALLLLAASLGAVAATVFVDVGWSRGWRDPAGAAITTAVLVGLGFALVAVARRESARWLETLGHTTLIAAAVKLVLVDLWLTHDRLRTVPPFAAVAVWGWLAAMAVVIWVSQSALTDSSPWPQLGALVAVVATVTAELARTAHGWRSSLITLWWATAAVALVIAGFAARRAAWRRLGLAVALIAALKLFLADIAALQGLHRVAAFLGAGAAMMVLSYLYQTAARTWRRPQPERPDP